MVRCPPSSFETRAAPAPQDEGGPRTTRAFSGRGWMDATPTSSIRAPPRHLCSTLGTAVRCHGTALPRCAFSLQYGAVPRGDGTASRFRRDESRVYSKREIQSLAQPRGVESREEHKEYGHEKGQQNRGGPCFRARRFRAGDAELRAACRGHERRACPGAGSVQQGGREICGAHLGRRRDLHLPRLHDKTRPAGVAGGCDPASPPRLRGRDREGVRNKKETKVRKIDARRYPCGFHSRARFCASASCADVISLATVSRFLTAAARLRASVGGKRAAARLNHICAATASCATPSPRA